MDLYFAFWSGLFRFDETGRGMMVVGERFALCRGGVSARD